MKLLRSVPAAIKRGFTLLEMMIVIMIIGILSSFLVVMVPEMLDNANLTASEQNMKRMYMGLTTWRQNHNGQWPRDKGIKFFLRPWKDGMVEKTESNAKMYFSPAESFEAVMVYQEMGEEDIDVVDYLNDWDSIGPGYTSYAGFNPQGDREVFRQLAKNPGLTTIISDAHMIHRFAMIYLTGDGVPHRMLKADMEDEYGLAFDDGDDVIVGAGCEIEEFQTVSND
ncbi:MAG: prepilin-type N-terminal cleavage/methylation domain-containing protein [Planctomycetes bacterium]|nr:prepilin-type N-terminal cleavage/methylation domain-containing protein [Planctomycetota bacterium]MCP4772472.1 prepilin-type N-terminal cleavage/methylation domain-containing protein [Planctomycetota bacterium]MCP4860135.1 prepilin-type N-terminal cleavage/methylation domain-containing protein [Planctomycetota bacterium]